MLPIDDQTSHTSHAPHPPVMEDFSEGGEPFGESAATPHVVSATPQKKIPKARFLVNETVVYAVTGSQAVELVAHRDASFTRLLSTDEQPYRRQLKIKEEWQRLDCGWAGERPSQVVLCNEEGQFAGGIPTAEKRAEVFARGIEVAVLTEDGRMAPFARVRPLESMRLEPAATLHARCLAGEAKVTLAAVPQETEESDGR